MDSRKMTDTLLDAAACEALGANSPTESAAYQQELAAAGDDARRADRDLREAVARLAAASPHLAPPPDLRGKFLQATAPVTFKMEDYRKATREPSRFYKWGFYAAMLFLMAGAYYNLTLQGAVKQKDGQIQAQAQSMQDRDRAVSTLLDPNCQQVTFKNQDGQPFGRAFVNEKSEFAVVILPEGAIPAGKMAQLQMPTADGRNIAYKTVLIQAPDAALAGGAFKGAQPGETVLAIQQTAPDLDARHPLESRPKIASQGK
jgi:hypothetical protein